MILSLAAARDQKKQGVTMIPMAKTLSADLLTPVAALMHLRQKGHACFLLESADGGESVGRYSFLGIDPFAQLTSQDGQLVYEQRGKVVKESPEDMMGRIGDYLNSFHSKALDIEVPFQGGAIGYVSYDAVHRLEDIGPLRKGAGACEARLMFFDMVVAFDRLKHKMHLISHIHAYSDKTLADEWRLALKRLAVIEDRLFHPRQAGQQCVLDENKPPLTVKAAMGREAYMAAVKKIKAHIRQGDIFQCVLSDRFRFKMDKEPFEVYRVLRAINPSPYLFFLDFADEVLLGSSPEMLVRVVGRSVETCPIAGTRPRGRSAKEDRKLESDLLASVKEKAEHLMLVDLGRNDLGRVAKPGSVNVKDFMQVGRFSHVMHLISLVEAKLRRGVTAWEAFCAAFPAGTLTGAPKIRAMQIISELEGQGRGAYGGAVVAHDFLGQLNSCITIRSLWTKGGEGVIQAGAGIVADSSPAKEYEEVLNKAMAMRKAVAATADGDLAGKKL